MKRHILTLLFAMIFVGAAFGAQEKVLYSFQGGVIGSTDGSSPSAGVLFDSAGNLYGTTEIGGLHNEGTVFELSLVSGVWVQTQIYNFQIPCNPTNPSCRDTGILPMADLKFDKQGNLYSVTETGGKYGNGTVFQLRPPVSPGGAWTENILHNFYGGKDGGVPLGGVFVLGDGRVFGTTGTGGPGGVVGCGLVFELAPPATGSTAWKEEILHDFGCAPDGDSPEGDLIMGPAGNLYGTTFGGGNGNCFGGCGTVYQLSPPATVGGAWTETVLYMFQNSPDGVGPSAGLVRDRAGNLYGTSYRGSNFPGGCQGVGCGTVFQLAPPTTPGGAWTETVIHNFTGGADGGTPLAGLTIDDKGNLYGTASAGGDLTCNAGTAVPGCGVVFELSPQAGGGWRQIVLHTFTGAPDGASPQAGITIRDGVLYGTTISGGTGANGGQGTVFAVVP
jgi:uncharacterized repeat protein (TIGR03803 family)